MGNRNSLTLWSRRSGRHELLHMDLQAQAWVRFGSREKFVLGLAGNGPCRRLLRLLHGDARRANYRLTVRGIEFTRFEYEPRTV